MFNGSCVKKIVCKCRYELSAEGFFEYRKEKTFAANIKSVFEIFHPLNINFINYPRFFFSFLKRKKTDQLVLLELVRRSINEDDAKKGLLL